MFHFFKKSKKEEVSEVTCLKAIVNGKAVALEEVPDEIFSSRAMGDGVAFDAEDGVIVAPCACTIETMSADMKHAVGLKLDNGMEILIHVGVDTVKLQGEGFTQLSKEGVKVEEGDPLLQFDQEVIRKNGLCALVIMIITEEGTVKNCRMNLGNVVKGSSVVAEW